MAFASPSCWFVLNILVGTSIRYAVPVTNRGLIYGLKTLPKYWSRLKRGKNDKLDARKIAMYAIRFQDEAKLFYMPEKTIATLKQLIKERGMYIVDKAKYQG